MSQPVRRRRVTAASPTPEKLSDFLRHLEASGAVSLAARGTGIARKIGRGVWRDGKRMGTIRDDDNRPLMFLRRTLKPEVCGRRAPP